MYSHSSGLGIRYTRLGNQSDSDDSTRLPKNQTGVPFCTDLYCFPTNPLCPFDRPLWKARGRCAARSKPGAGMCLFCVSCYITRASSLFFELATLPRNAKALPRPREEHRSQMACAGCWLAIHQALDYSLRCSRWTPTRFDGRWQTKRRKKNVIDWRGDIRPEATVLRKPETAEWSSAPFGRLLFLHRQLHASNRLAVPLSPSTPRAAPHSHRTSPHHHHRHRHHTNVPSNASPTSLRQRKAAKPREPLPNERTTMDQEQQHGRTRLEVELEVRFERKTCHLMMFADRIC